MSFWLGAYMIVPLLSSAFVAFEMWSFIIAAPFLTNCLNSSLAATKMTMIQISNGPLPFGIDRQMRIPRASTKRYTVYTDM